MRAAIARCGKTHVSRLQGKEVTGKLLYYFIIQTMTCDYDIVHNTFLIKQPDILKFRPLTDLYGVYIVYYCPNQFIVRFVSL